MIGYGDFLTYLLLQQNLLHPDKYANHFRPRTFFLIWSLHQLFHAIPMRRESGLQHGLQWKLLWIRWGLFQTT